jgi:hypothetical protein
MNNFFDSYFQLRHRICEFVTELESPGYCILTKDCKTPSPLAGYPIVCTVPVDIGILYVLSVPYRTMPGTNIRYWYLPIFWLL